MEIVEDLLVTESLLVRGRVEGKTQRLSALLKHYTHLFLPVREAHVVDMRTSQSRRVERLLLNLRDLLFAHEFLDLAGDQAWTNMAKGRDRVVVRAVTRGALAFELTGLVGGQVFGAAGDTEPFLVMEQPTITARGLEVHDEFKVLKTLPYVILRRDALAGVVLEDNVPKAEDTGDRH